MRSIYQKALGTDFERLHPLIQQRFGFSSQDGVASIGRGVMERIWRGPFWTLPFLAIGAWRRIMFPARGTGVPFMVENYAYIDGFGRETITWNRHFDLPGKMRRFDATMIYSEERGHVVDYLGSHQHLAVDIELAMTENGGLRLRSGAQRLYEGMIGVSFPMFFSGYADVCEWFDETSDLYRIRVEVSNPFWGPLFGYVGSFDVEWRECPADDIPPDAKPQREERRE